MDFCSMGKKCEDAQPILVARDRDTRMTVSFLVQSKGVLRDYFVRTLLAFLREVGHHENRLILKSDQESPIKAVVEKSAREARGREDHFGELAGAIVRQQWSCRPSGEGCRVPRAFD